METEVLKDKSKFRWKCVKDDEYPCLTHNNNIEDTETDVVSGNVSKLLKDKSKFLLNIWQSVLS